MEVGIATTAFLILFPVLVALILMFVRDDRARSYITVVGALVIACGSIFCAAQFLSPETHLFAVDDATATIIGYIALVIEVALCLYIIIKGIYYRKPLAIALAIIQLGLVFYLDLAVAEHVNVVNELYIDNFSIIMALIIGIVGSGIIVYGLGYMRVHEAHNDGPDRRSSFFSVMFAFLGAMFAIVFCNSLTWMLCAWEVTTVCSFALIGYTRTKEAIDNSFLQIVLNMIGGIAFTIALIWVGSFYGVMELDRFIESTLALAAAGMGFVTYAPLLLFALAAFTKAAQMPFQSWLLGAMVAPTPTSALLHSSNMVKAGVFLLIKLSPIFLVCPVAAVMTILVGGLTFLLCSFMAISQTNAKRVLAYSTIANLGLIVACAGVGTPEAVWAATFLVLFHAVAKSLLFLCVGTAEHHIGSRDIEDMDLMFERMPRLARFMMAGIMIMFVAPFGMLIAKWGTLVSFADTGNVALILILGFGSAATFLFWAKWLGKLSGIAAHPLNVETTVHRSEWIALMVMAVLSMLCCVGLPVLSTFLVEPYIFDVFGVCSQGVSQANLWVAALLSAVVFVVLFGGLGSKQVKQVPVYLAGVSENNANRTFRNSLSGETMATSRNWYMEGVFGEPKITPVGVWATSIIIVVGFCAAIATLCGLL